VAAGVTYIRGKWYERDAHFLQLVSGRQQLGRLRRPHGGHRIGRGMTQRTALTHPYIDTTDFGHNFLRALAKSKIRRRGYVGAGIVIANIDAGRRRLTFRVEAHRRRTDVEHRELESPDFCNPDVD